MCTVTNKAPELQVANEDIVVYKCVKLPKFKIFSKLFKRGLTFKSILTPFIYKQNEVYTTSLDPFILQERRDNLLLWISQRGFYSFESKNLITNVECIIPKGAYYYKAFDLGMCETIYHSNKIKIVDIIRD